MRLVLTLAAALASVACKRQPPPESHAEPAPSAVVPLVDCKVNVPPDSEVSDATENSFWIHPKGKTKSEGFEVVNAPMAFKPKSLEPRGKNEAHSVDRDLRFGGHHVEGTFELEGKSFYAVDIAQRCGATKLLSCRLVSGSEALVQYASRICIGLVK